MESSDCAVALQPSIFHNNGADERDRFLSGARTRGELALAVVVIGDAEDDLLPSPLARHDSSVHLDRDFTSVGGRRLPAGVRPVIAPDLSAADRDLAMRLLNRPADAPWWALELSALQEPGPGGSPMLTHEPAGALQPILMDSLGTPVVAAWVPPTGDQRWYILPDVPGWDGVLDWLIRQALPEFAPSVLRRVRSPFFSDPDLRTSAETAARQALEDLETRYGMERRRLEEAVRTAESRAEPIRYGLLYGSGGQLVQAVAQVLAAAGIRTADLDNELGGTLSADLLAGRDGGPPQRLIEVKSASGTPGERLVDDLKRHLSTWPQVRPSEPVTGGVLVVNHQYAKHPSERTPHVYTRAEFVATLQVPVVSTLELFHWWRDEDWAAIRAAILGRDAGPEPGETPAPNDSATTESPSADRGATGAARRTGRFRRRR